MISPLFPQELSNKTGELLVSYPLVKSPHQVPIMTINIITTADARPVQDVNEAEDIILGLVEVQEHQVPNDAKVEYYAGVLIQAMRYGNQIASQTRRASSNVVLMGRELFKKVQEGYEALGINGFRSIEPEAVGRWEKVGTALDSIAIYVGDAIAENEVFVAYVGTGSALDSAGGLLEEDGQLYLRMIGESHDIINTPEAYVRKFRLITT